MPQAPRVLMVVPTLGTRPRLLDHCLQSIRSQSAGTVDLVLVAPPGADLGDVVSTYDARVVEDPRRGISAALNAGLAAADAATPYFAWLGDDDLLTPGSLARTIGVLDGDPGAVMAFGWCDYIDEDGRHVFASRAGRLAARIIAFGPNLVPQPGSLMRRDAVVAVGGLDEGISLALDLDLFLRLRRRGRLVSIPHTLACFRWHAGSSTVQDEDASAEQSDRIRMRYMSPPAARVYEVARWPGRWALRLAKRRVDRNVRRAAVRI